MTVWYTSDQHYGHRNILTLCRRPFADLEHMHAQLIARWNALVAPADTVWVLGDFALSPKALYLARELNGNKILVAGNHDSCWNRHRRWARGVRKYLDAGFAEVHASGQVRGHELADGTRVNLAHLPYAGDSRCEDRYSEYRIADDGLPLLCGHVHDTWKTRGRQINVGVDMWEYRPVAESELRGLVHLVAGYR